MREILDHIRALEDYLAGSGASLHRLPMPERLLGQQSRDRIQLRTGLTPEEELPALVHELTHWLVHDGGGSGPERTIVEYEAEAVEAVVLSRLGLQRLLPAACLPEDLDPAEALLTRSRARVTFACERICAALGIATP